MAATRPDVERTKPFDSIGQREVFRYEKDGRIRIYNLRVTDSDHAELWVASGRPGKITGSQRKATFDNPDDTSAFLDDVEMTLRTGAWRRL